ncbi:MAG: TIGR00282 family metallophosphoesterase [Alkalispirochaetaceae bacterium]
MRVLFLGEIVGKSGVFCVKQRLKELRESLSVDCVIANGDGATGGFGLGKNHAIYLRKLGVDVITSGEQIYYKRDMKDHLQQAPYILRPANFPPGNAGRGWRTYTIGDEQIGVISLLGQSGYNRVHPTNPYTFLPEIVRRLRENCSIIVLDYHALTTAEKLTMFFHADGLVSAVVGTGTRVPTADERVSAAGTATICDAGRTGSIDSVGGLEPSVEIRKFMSQMPERSDDAWERLEIQGVLMEFERDGRALSIERVRESCSRHNQGES